MNLAQPTIPVRIAGFLVAMVAVFGLAFGIGRTVGPVGGDVPAQQPGVHQQHTE